MIKRPKGLEIVELTVEFNFQKFTCLEIDLEHVNKDQRSNFSLEDVSQIVLVLIDNLRLSPSGEKEFGDDICSYFVRSASYEDKNFKLVFCICSDRPATIGVITLHRT